MIERMADGQHRTAYPNLTYLERFQVAVCIDHYLADIRKACLEDQGTADGERGTVGHAKQQDLLDLRAMFEVG